MTLWLLLATCVAISAADDSLSLRSALNAIDRRQRDLSIDYDYPEYVPAGYGGYTGIEKPDDVAFLNVAANYDPNAFSGKEEFLGSRSLGDLLQSDEFVQPPGYNKRISSSFRERLEEDRQRQREEFAKTLMTNLENNGIPVSGNNLDEEYLQNLWERYYGNDLDRYHNSKRYYYPFLGADAIGLRKRPRYDDWPYGSHHRFLQEEDPQMNYMRNVHHRRSSEMKPYYPYYDEAKILPISKRSSNYISRPNEKKNSNQRKATDPKVEKDLSNIFGPQLKVLNAKASSEKTTKAPEIKTVTQKTKNKQKEAKNDINKEVFSPVAPVIEKPLPIKKKSINWSDYFGLDRRKKSDPALDKEWLLERYHKAIAIGTKKRNAELVPASLSPLSETSNKNQGVEGAGGKPISATHDKKQQDLVERLENMEENVLQDAIKYTGAHQDDIDTQEIQNVKDKIISRLAAAYNLEKMKLALEDLKNSHNTALLQDDDYTYEEKRTAVPRKEAVDYGKDESPKTENSIKCTGTDVDCYEQNYKTPSEIIDSHLATGQCAPIQESCKRVSMLVGQYGPVFETACSMHQMCHLCSVNSWFSPTRQCNALFLSKTQDLCKSESDEKDNNGNECKRESTRFLRYLPEVTRMLESQSYLMADCEVMCPISDTWSSK